MSCIPIANSVRGASHVRKNTVNQDSIGGGILGNKIAFIAVADGHGGNEYTRSDVGSSLAIKAVMQTLMNLPSSSTEADILSELDGVQQTWKTMVQDEISRHGGTVRMYGTTLSVAVKSASGGVALWCCGDGDAFILINDVAHLLPGDGMVGVETHSLGTVKLSQIRREQRTATQITQRGVTGIILTTDGVVNSFTTEQEAERTVSAMVGRTPQEVEATLQIITEQGSGDDVSLIMLKL